MTSSPDRSIIRPVEHTNPNISVIIPTVPGNDHKKVIYSLRNQTYEEFDVILVNDSDLGVCEARNYGLKRATGDIIAFTDDDCQPPNNWIETIHSAFEDHKDLVILEGRVEGGMKYEGQRKYPTCNLAVDRETAIKAGGFDERFEYWREDTEFGWQLEEYGRASYNEDVKMFHPDRPRSSIIEENERLLRQIYPNKYDNVILPETVIGRVNDWLWRKGFWDAFDTIRYDIGVGQRG